jgi:Domain of unknown function (DUF4956)
MNKIEFSGFEIIDPQGFFDLVIRFSLNMGVIMLLVRWLYYTATRRKDYMFTYLMVSSVVFLLCFLLENVKLQLGFALGLFAIFGIIRYRTDAIPIKEMTYLFVIIGISVINALSSKKISMAELLFTNAIIVFIAYGIEKRWLLKHQSVKSIVYEKIDLIQAGHYDELLSDLQERTGIQTIKRIEIGKINFLKDACNINIYYEETDLQINLADQQSTYAARDLDDDDD